jgi:hypothetical protein
MKKNILVFNLLFLFSFSAYAFEFKGVQSGMSPEEVSAVIGSEVTKSTTIYDDKAKIWLPKITPIKAGFRFTNDNKLWRIVITDYKGSFADAAGKKNILEKICSDVDEGTHKIGSGSYSYNMDTYECFLIDTALFKQDIKFYETKTLELWE